MSTNSYKMKIDPRRRKFVRLVSLIHAEIDRALQEECASRGISQNDVARILGIDQGALSRRLSGTSNLTLRSIADLAWALDRDIDFAFNVIDSQRSSNTNRPQQASTSANAEIRVVQPDGPVTTAVASGH